QTELKTNTSCPSSHRRCTWCLEYTATIQRVNLIPCKMHPADRVNGSGAYVGRKPATSALPTPVSRGFGHSQFWQPEFVLPRAAKLAYLMSSVVSVSQTLERYGREWHHPGDPESKKRRGFFDFDGRNGFRSGRNNGREECRRAVGHGAGGSGSDHFRTRFHARSRRTTQAHARNEGR